MAMHFHFSKNKKPSQCSPKASHSGKNHQKSFHPSKSLQTPPNLSKPSKSPKIFPHLSKSPKITRNFPKTQTPAPATPKPPPNPPEHPQTSPHPPQTHQNTSQILRNHPIRQISGQNLTPLSANFSTAFGKFGTSREPVGKIRAPPQKAQKCWFLQGFGTFLVDFWQKPLQKVPNSTKKVPNPCKNQHFCAFWGGARIFPTGSRLVPDWFPTGSEFAESGVRFQFFGCQKNALFRAETGWNQTKPFPISRLLSNFPVGLTLRKGLKSAPFLRPKRIPKTEKKGAT